MEPAALRMSRVRAALHAGDGILICWIALSIKKYCWGSREDIVWFGRDDEHFGCDEDFVGVWLEGVGEAVGEYLVFGKFCMVV